jgi:hypothetical protein
MAIKLIANYSKRLGLPGYSSHQFSVSVETELMTTDDLAGESERLYQRLQSSVDEQMLHTGFVPPADYGMDPPSPDSTAPRRYDSTPSNVTTVANWQRGPAWKCSDKQKDLILKLVDEHQLDKDDVEALANERFGKGVRLLNKVEASGLIDELLDTHGSGQRQGNRRNGSAYRRQNGRDAA